MMVKGGVSNGGFTTYFLLSIFLVISSTQAAEYNGRTWYVSLNGEDDSQCSATRDRPCRHLNAIISRSRAGDVIQVDGGGGGDGGEEAVFTLEHRDNDGNTYAFNKGIHLLGVNAPPRLIIERGDNGMAKRAAGRGLRKCVVKLQNLIVADGNVSFIGCDAHITRVKFDLASIKAEETCSSRALLIEDSEFHGESDCSDHTVSCKATFDNFIQCDSLNVTLLSSRFYQSRLKIASNGKDEEHKRTITVHDSLFTNKEDKMRKLGGLQITIPREHGDIDVKNTVFSHLIHPSHTQSIINLYEAALQVRSVAKSKENKTYSEVTLNSEGNTFFNNERAITIIGPFKAVNIRESKFESNIAVHAGGAILLLAEEGTIVNLTNCQFVGNRAGVNRAYYPHKPETSVDVKGNEVHIASDCCNGVVKMVGKGGAIRVQRGRAFISHCTFTNNTASEMGGSIMVDASGRNYLSLHDSQFSNSPVGEVAEQGDIIYSRGEMEMERVQFDVLTAEPGLTVVQHFGNHWSMEVNDIFIQCPPGYNVRATNSTAYGVTSVGLRKSYKLDDLTYSCQACRHADSYSERGSLNYTITYESFAHFALRIDGKKLDEDQKGSSGTINHHKINCEIVSTSGFVGKYVNTAVLLLTVFNLLLVGA